MNKYFTEAVCRNESKKRPFVFFREVYDRKNWKVFCKRVDKKFKRLMDPGICSLHFKESDMAITFLGVKIFLQAAIRLSLTLQKRRMRPVHARRVLTIERGVVLNKQKLSRAKHRDFSKQTPRKKN